MSLTPSFRFSLLAFPQSWDSANIVLRILTLPQGDPLSPFITGVPPAPDSPAFADAKLKLQAALIPSLAALPQPADVSAQVPLTFTVPSNARALFQQLQASFSIAPAPPGATPKRTGYRTRKYLPDSYRAAFAFDRPRTPFGVTDDKYSCLLNDPPIKTPQPAPPSTVSWGRVFAFALRQPLLASALGLLYEASFALPSPSFFSSGGWLYISLDPASDFAPQFAVRPDLLQAYAARIPALSSTSRPLFAAVLFPVLSVPPPDSYDEVFSEAEDYDDGFAKIVHGAQPARALLTDTTPDGLPPVGDFGIRLGWDDEQVAIWLNRQIDANALDAPAGVAAYRVDVRQHGDTQWHSLCEVTGTMQLNGTSLGTFNGELGVETPPIRHDPTTPGEWWLPSYFTQWRGVSLVLGDAIALQTSGSPDPTPSRQYQPVDDNAVPLRYGQNYDFRVRLSDLSRGGPKVSDNPVNPAPAPIGDVPFRRYTPPKQLTVTNYDETATPAKPQTLYTIQRPRLGYPDLVFTGFPNAVVELLADVPSAKAQKRDVGLPDPDVVTLRIDVEVRALDHDAAAITATDHTPFALLYTTTRDFPADPSATLDLEVSYQDVPDITTFPPQPASGPVVVPTARDVRLTFYPVCRPDPTLSYFGSDAVRTGHPNEVVTRSNSSDERNLYVPDIDANRFRAIMLQPDPVPTTNLAQQLQVLGQQGTAQTDLMGRLALALDLNVSGLTLSGRNGRRVVFGCSKALRHILSPDHGSIAFASKADLTRHWIAVITLQLQRDWSWDELGDVSFEITNESSDVVGSIDLRRGLTATALTNPDRTKTYLIFLDAIDPKPDPGSFPAERNIGYTVMPQFIAAPVEQDPPLSLSLELPMATPPSQTPQLASAGIALSPYSRSVDYSSTGARERVLWFEFSEPPDNPRDTYFARVLSYAPDPVLTGDQVLTPGPGPINTPPEPPLPIDPELIRIITPGMSDDRAGLDAMQQLIASDSPLHYAVPLPPGLSPDSPELFGFFVYELRGGHAQGWSTAQGRFGRPLRITGVQHPTPVLSCVAARQKTGITVSAPFAVPVFGGQNLTPFPPRSEIWVLLYAQVIQADGADHRNILLSRKPARVPDQRFASAFFELRTLNLSGRSFWDDSEVKALLAALALPLNSPLSVLAVEALPELGRRADPLGANLGYIRILRASPLAPVPAIC
ncbi:MAG: hypothetical protein ACHP8B_13830 [Terriglobales bacterium]